MLPALHRLRLSPQPAEPTGVTHYDHRPDGWILGWEDDEGDGNGGANSPPPKSATRVAPLHEERLVYKRSPDGTYYLYEGKANEERLVQSGTVQGWKSYYKGGPSHEARYLMVSPKGSMYHYEGPALQERKVRVDYHNGSTSYFTGPAPQEKLTFRREKDGREITYGENEEKRSVYYKGVTTYYRGPRNHEAKFKVVEGDPPRVTMRYYKGPPGEERLVLITLEGYDDLCFTGPKENERRVWCNQVPVEDQVSALDRAVGTAGV